MLRHFNNSIYRLWVFHHEKKSSSDYLIVCKGEIVLIIEEIENVSKALREFFNKDIFRPYGNINGLEGASML